jgi:hypothetical protein
MAEMQIDEGYLVMADLSGFTSFVAKGEIDHAQVILTNLLNVLRARLTPALTLAEVEGDALFLYAADGTVPRGETLLELIEDTYVAFRDKQRTMQHNAVCPCEACRMIPTLDLKFVVHHGQYVLQSVTGSTKPFGNCVNLVHRLLKNDVTESTGWRAYALYTSIALDAMDVQPQGMHVQSMEYEHLGEFSVSASNLRTRYDELTAERTSFLDDSDAHFKLSRRYALPRARVWELLTDIEIRNQWEMNADWREDSRPGGRSGAGSTNHCAASGFIEEILDWRPFDYYTSQFRYGPVRLRVTGQLIEDGDGTDVRWRMSLESLLPGPIRGPICRFFANRLMRAPERFSHLDRLVESEATPAATPL